MTSGHFNQVEKSLYLVQTCYQTSYSKDIRVNKSKHSFSSVLIFDGCAVGLLTSGEATISTLARILFISHMLVLLRCIFSSSKLQHSVCLIGICFLLLVYNEMYVSENKCLKDCASEYPSKLQFPW